MWMRSLTLLLLFCFAHVGHAQKNYFKLFKIEFLAPDQVPVVLDYSSSFDYARIDMSTHLFDLPSLPQYRYNLLSRTETSNSDTYRKFEGQAIVEGEEIKYRQEQFPESDKNVFTFYLNNGTKAVFTCSLKTYRNSKIALDHPFPEADSLDSVPKQSRAGVYEYLIEEVNTKIGGEEKPVINLDGKNVTLSFDVKNNLIEIPAIKSTLLLSDLHKLSDDNKATMYEGIATDAGTKWKFTYYIEKQAEETIFELESLNEEGTGTIYLCKGPINQRSNEEPGPTNRYEVSGTGFFVTGDGVLATNAHVVDQLENINVTVNSDTGIKTYTAKVIAVDKNHDVALVKIVDPGFVKLDEIPYRLSSVTDVGERVFTIGYPLDDIMGSNYKLTDGIVSSLTGLVDDSNYLQISLPLLPGNSGGPLFDSNGDVIGLTTSRLEGQKIGIQVDNVSYAIKTSHLTNLLKAFGFNYPSKSKLHGLHLKDQVKKVKNYVVTIRGDLVK